MNNQTIDKQCLGAKYAYLKPTSSAIQILTLSGLSLLSFNCQKRFLGTPCLFNYTPHQQCVTGNLRIFSLRISSVIFRTIFELEFHSLYFLQSFRKNSQSEKKNIKNQIRPNIRSFELCPMKGYSYSGYFIRRTRRRSDMSLSWQFIKLLKKRGNIIIVLN